MTTAGGIVCEYIFKTRRSCFDGNTALIRKDWKKTMAALRRRVGKVMLLNAADVEVGSGSGFSPTLFIFY
jgi:hypothetical protein